MVKTVSEFISFTLLIDNKLINLYFGPYKLYWSKPSHKHQRVWKTKTKVQHWHHSSMTWLSSDCCWETPTLIFGKVREGSFWSADGALTKLMPCSNSLAASISSFSFLPFILLEIWQNVSKEQKENTLKTFFDIYTSGLKELPILVVSLLPADSDLIDLWNGLEDTLSKIPVISLWPVSLSLKLKGWILKQRIIVMRPL